MGTRVGLAATLAPVASLGHHEAQDQHGQE